MRYDPLHHHRHTLRLKDYDYARAGAYFVTLCTQGRLCVLEDPVVAGILLDVWYALPARFPTIALDEFVVMPNHVHFIVWLQSVGVGATLAVAPMAGTVAPMAADDATGMNDQAGAIGAAAIGAGASPAPTGGAGESAGATVGATLAVAPEAIIQNPSWHIPPSETINANPTLGDVVGAFKSLAFAVYYDWVQVHAPERRAIFWQRNYYEHIIRNARELAAVRAYIRDNPLRWAQDKDNPVTAKALQPMPDYWQEAVI